MSYTHTTRSAFRALLAARLGDPSMVHWISAELDLIIGDALCKWSTLTGQYRARGVFNTTINTPLYYPDTISALSTYLSLSRTDRDEIGIMQYMLREPYDPIDGTGMSDQFTFASLVSALGRARDQFLSDTHSVTGATSLTVIPGDPIELADTVIAIRRAVWLSQDGAYYNLHLSDESEAMSYNTLYSLSPGIPELYCVSAAPQLQIRLVPPPLDSGTLELLTVSTGAALNNPTTPTVLGVPDDWTWAVRALALSDLLGRDGPGYDPSRAASCLTEYQLGASLAVQSTRILAAHINGSPVLPSSIADIDYAYASPHWQSAATGTPVDMGTSGGDVIALRPVPDSSAHSVTLDLVRKAPLPATGVGGDDDFIEVSRDDLSALLDGAQATALFKLGGSSIDDARSLMGRMITAAIRYNSRLSTLGYAYTQARSSQLESDVRAEAGGDRGVGTVSAGNAGNTGNTGSTGNTDRG